MDKLSVYTHMSSHYEPPAREDWQEPQEHGIKVHRNRRHRAHRPDVIGHEEPVARQLRAPDPKTARHQVISTNIEV